ncbi:MAG: hypothetical protein AAB445_01840 [Patescibacteria group bacterium]
MQMTTTQPQLQQVALTFPMGDIVARYVKENPTVASEAALHEKELKKYLFLCAKYPGQGWPMVTTLDELWHTFIIFTKEYHSFCQQLGVQYLHHQPFGGCENMQEIQSAYSQFLVLYRQEFGEPPTAIWPRKLSSDCGTGCSGGGCSGIGCGSSCGSSCR